MRVGADLHRSAGLAFVTERIHIADDREADLVASGLELGDRIAAQAEEIAKTKMPDLNCDSLDAAIKTVAGTARSMGLDVFG